MRLRIVLALLALYTGLFGLLFLLAQDLAVRLLDVGVRDPVAWRQWGASLLTLSGVVAVLAWDPLRVKRLLWALLAGLVLASAALLYDLATGASGGRQVGPPLLLNSVFLGLLAAWYPRPPSSRDVHHTAHSKYEALLTRDTREQV